LAAAPLVVLSRPRDTLSRVSDSIDVGASDVADTRVLCSNGACNGVIGDDGVCKVCGTSPAAAPEAAPVCALCGATVAAGTGAVANGRSLCATCTSQVERDFQEQTRNARIAPAIALGLVGSIVGAAVWAGIAIATNYAIGYVAVLVGFLAGYGVRRGAGSTRTQLIRGIAIGCAVFGLLLAKFIMVVQAVAAFAIEKNGADIPYFDLIWFKVFWEVFPKTLTAFDALWLFLAISAAARQVKPIQLQLTAR
jgi:hypothetical protein